MKRFFGILLVLIVVTLSTAFAQEKVADPVFSIPGGVYDSPQRVRLSTTTEGAEIYYTTDGSDPLTSQTRIRYFWRITVNQTMTIKAVAVKEGMEPSNVVEQTYIIRVQPPIANPPAGEWKKLPEQVELSSPTPGATIYYTLDGSTPTRNSLKYTGPIKLEKGKTNIIKAFAVKDDGSPDSPVVTFVYKENPHLVLLTDVLKPGTSVDFVIKKVIEEMTLEEKVKLVWGAGFPSPLGAAGWTHAIQRLGIPSLELADGPAGLRLGFIGQEGSRRATAWPNPMMLASTWNTELVKRIGEAIGEECKYYGIDIILGPGMNIHRDPLGGRVFEYYSEDPHVTGKMAAAWIKGVQKAGVGATMKHYTANNAENNRQRINEIISERALREIYMAGFEIATKEANPWAVMTAYNKINGNWCSENEYILKVLKHEFGFEGLVMSDWGAYHNPISYKYGFDLNTPGGTFTPGGPESLIEAVKEGVITEKDIERAVETILRVVIKTEAFKKQIYDKSEFAAKTDLPNDLKEKHAKLSKEAALEGIVLLKNSENTLPLKDISKIALVGKLAYREELPTSIFAGELVKGMYFEGGGSAAVVVNWDDVVTLRDAFRKAGFEVVEKGTSGEYLGEGMSEEDALFAAKESDVAVILIGRPGTEGRDNTPDRMKLTSEELDMIKKTSEAFHKFGKKVIVLLNVAHPIETDDWDDFVDAILYIGLPGTYGATAVTEVLTGKVNPSGKLVDTWPKKYEYAPTYGNMPAPDATEITYTEDIFVGYRYYDLHPEKVKYPFGYGLSYTTFKYTSIELDKDVFNLANEDETIRVTVTVRNTGKVPGKEVVQLYVKADDNSVLRPYKELKGFAKTRLLEPGEEERITFTLDKRAFAYFDETIHEWVVLPGTYTIIVGGTSDNAVLEKEGLFAKILIIRDRER